MNGIKKEVEKMKQALQTGQACQQIAGNQLYTPVYDEPVAITGNREQTECNYQSYGIPKRYRNVTMEYIVNRGVPEQAKQNVADVQRYIDNLEDNLQNGNGMVLRGNVGTMKTTLAIAIMRAVIAKGRSAYFIPMANLMDRLFSGNPDERSKLEQKLQTVSILVIDDLGMEYEKGWVTAKIRAIINDRYNEEKSTIITTNLEKDINDRYVNGMLDRIASTSTFSNFSGKSLRK